MICLSYERTKYAALIYDHVLPVPTLSRSNVLSTDLGNGFVEKYHDEFFDGANAIQLESILPEGVTGDYLAGAIIYSAVSLVGSRSDEELQKYMDLMHKNFSSPPLQLFVHVAREYLAANNKAKPWIDFLHNFALSKIDAYEVLGSTELIENRKDDPSPFIQFTGVPIIDVSKLSWEQIIEIRNDENSKRRLRRLRSFISSNYKSKSRQEIEDDLLTRIYDYEESAKALGLETAKAIFNVGGSEKIASAATSGLLALLAGAPPTLASAIGAAAVLGGIFVQVVTHRKHFERNQDRDPVRYIIDIKETSRTEPD